MVLQRGPDGTGRLVPQTGLATIAQADPTEQQRGSRVEDAIPAAKFDFINASQGRTTVACRLTIFDWRDNFRQLVTVEEGHASKAASTSETRFKGYAHPPFLTTKQNTITPTTPDTVFWTPYLNRAVIATTGGPGALAASILMAETSTTNPALANLSYTFGGGGACYGLWTGYLNNSTTKLLLIGTSGVTDAVNDLATPPTDVGTNMEANSAGMTAFFQFDLPGFPFICVCGTTMYSGVGTAAINQTLTAVAQSATGIPAGTKIIGQQGLGGRTARLFMLQPIGVSAIATVFGATGWPHNIVSRNIYGSDPKPHDVGIEDVEWSFPLRDGLVCGGDNGSQVNFYDGEIHRLEIFKDRATSSSQYLRVTGGHPVSKTEFIVDVCSIANPSGGSGLSTFHQERYDFDLHSWSQVSETISLDDGGATTGLKAARGTPSLPFGPLTRNLHSCGGSGVTSMRFGRKFEPRPGENPYFYRGVQSFAASSTVLTPGFIFPAPVTYAPKVVTAVYYGGDPTGGAASIADPGAMKIEIGEYGFTAGAGVKAVYDSTTNNPGRVRENPQNLTRILNPQIAVTMTQGTTVTQVPQALPITIEFLAFLEEKKARSWLPWR